jgi:paraquat-inducible protein A
MDAFIACHECDVIQHKPNSLERTLAFAFAGLILFILANSFPFLGLKIGSQVRETTLITGIYELYVQGMQVIAILVLFTTVLVPFTQMLCLLYILLPLKSHRLPKGLPRLFRFVNSVGPWGMMEVFMVGILVSLVKLAGMAKITPGISLYSFLALIFVLAAMTVSLDSHLIWQKWEEHR